jgi:hypothetical protein
MRRESPIPPEFLSLVGKIRFIVQRSKTEWSSSCPECGGEIHQKGGEFPDRFRMWPVSKYGKPLGWCRNCGYVWTPAHEHKPTREEIELWRQEQIRVETERKKAAERALELLNSQHLWERFHTENTPGSRQIMRSWGISESWQDYLKLGYVQDYTVWHKEPEDNYRSAAITMPVWWACSKVQNIKIRVLNPTNENDRYRNWYKTGEHYFYMPLHDIEFSGGGVILVEGEKKAIVAEENNPTTYRVIGMQSKRPDPDLFSLLDDCEPIYVIPDPDAFQRDKNGGRGVDYLTSQIGKERARIVRLPVKLDDGIVQHNLNLAHYIKNAVKA